MSSERQRVERMLGEANIHFAYREFQQAVAMLLEVVRLAPGMPHPYQTLGLIYEEMGRPLKALKLFMMAAHLSGRRDAQQWRQLASLCIKHGELQQASYCLAKLTVLQPNDPDALYDRARLLVHLGQYKRAADVLSNLLEQRPTDAGIARRLAQFSSCTCTRTGSSRPRWKDSWPRATSSAAPTPRPLPTASCSATTQACSRTPTPRR